MLAEDVDDFDFPLEAASPAATQIAAQPSPSRPSQISKDSFKTQSFKSIAILRRICRWITVYPIYFDLKRPHKKGQRRVPNEKAVIYPLAQDIANAASRLGFRVVLEADKTHPADWANPGRVRIMLKNETTGKPTNPRIPNPPILQDTAAIPTPKVQPGEEVFTDELKKQMSELPIEKKLPRHSPAVSTGFIDRMMGFGGRKVGRRRKGRALRKSGHCTISSAQASKVGHNWVIPPFK
ncbi:signal recognition particle, SRP19 subunit [Atractiella rhizophila]|nr:signal recognition particle, SRP19 subunit [Atractiella rhizophila]